ncbi:MAG: phosphatidylserine decarboxylase family protein [Bacteroidales bacterium]|jgi:phosphatidylserine decarboxylase|nr:phosphatidylserine decarboxylase family protein [Bacteroidales bacterium]MDD4214032.1 phosphatidylserine decarboxylase family protein [Bacteroidales bacterium]
MKIHKEGKVIILIFILIFFAINIPLFLFFQDYLLFDILMLAFTFIWLIIIIRFFREPSRDFVLDDKIIFSGADGVVVAIEEINEEKYLNEKRIQVSVFMSLNNVHVNWFPVSGKVIKTEDYYGRYFVARKPKSSYMNEQTTTIIKPEGRSPILVRQIAGFVARRIICYAEEKMQAMQCDQLGFIKFGSRVDILLPLDTEILVKIKDKVRGGITPIARYKD